MHDVANIHYIHVPEHNNLKLTFNAYLTQLLPLVLQLLCTKSVPPMLARVSELGSYNQQQTVLLNHIVAIDRMENSVNYKGTSMKQVCVTQICKQYEISIFQQRTFNNISNSNFLITGLEQHLTIEFTTHTIHENCFG